MTEPGSALEGIRVLDLGIVTAGAASSQVLADFGAEVIKVESTTYHDPFRDWGRISGMQSAAESDSAPFNFVNRGKRGVAINLKDSTGRAVFLKLVAVSDVIVENFRRGVLDRLGLSIDELKKANPRIVVVSLSSQGELGPESSYVSFGSTLEALGGLTAVTGYGEAEPPVWTGNNVNYPDQIVSILAPGIALAAIRARDRSGEAIHVDLAQREVVASVVGEAVLDHTLTGRKAVPQGNRHERFAPQGVYAAAGDDRWIAISVQSDLQWTQFCEFFDDEALSDPEHCTADGRRRHHDRLDERIERITSGWDSEDLAARLQACGVPASPVLRPAEVIEHPQLSALGFPRVNADTGIVDRGFVASLSATPGRTDRRAPRIGEHTVEVLRDVLHYDSSEVQELYAAGAVWFEQRTADSSTR
ncbi:CaiB/BaiF CoA transferase family protein [Nesterenkonia suensis]